MDRIPPPALLSLPATPPLAACSPGTPWWLCHWQALGPEAWAPRASPSCGGGLPVPLVDICSTRARALVAGWSPAPHLSLLSCTGMFPGKGGMVAPGMTCQYTIQFFPDCLGDFDDFILVETQSPHKLLIPLQARRPPPVLTRECVPCPPGGSLRVGESLTALLAFWALCGSTQLGRGFWIPSRDLPAASTQSSSIRPLLPHLPVEAD